MIHRFTVEIDKGLRKGKRNNFIISISLHNNSFTSIVGRIPLFSLDTSGGYLWSKCTASTVSGHSVTDLKMWRVGRILNATSTQHLRLCCRCKVTSNGNVNHVEHQVCERFCWMSSSSKLVLFIH